MSACRNILEPDETVGGLSSMARAFSEIGSRRKAFDILVSFARAQGLMDLILTIETNAASPKWGEMRWSTLDPDRLAGLEALGFDGHDPIRRFARRSIDPFVWTVRDWPGLNTPASRNVMIGLQEVSIQAGLSVAVWGRAGRVAVMDAFGTPARIGALSPWKKEAIHLVTAMTFRAIERLSLVREGAALTRREIEILDLASQGLTTRTIARRLEIVEPTVKFHLKGIRVKLNARNTLEAIARFAALDLSVGVAADRRDGRTRRSVNQQSNTSPPP